MRFNCGAIVVLLILSGCDAPTPPPSSAEALPIQRPRRSPANPHCTLSGRVVWTGPAPHVSPVTAVRPRPDRPPEVITRPAPNAPVISSDGGVAGAVVFLRGIDPARARQWDRPPVIVELHDSRAMIHQGDNPPTNVGFVHRGDDITIVSHQDSFHALRARGAAFWTLTVPDPNRPRTRRLNEPGVVELSSGVNYFWMRGYLWVCEHPYYVATDAAGRWTLTGVPSGEYDVVAWLPDWRTVRQELDPESGAIARYVFRPPLTVVRRVTVPVDGSIDVGDLSIRP